MKDRSRMGPWPCRHSIALLLILFLAASTRLVGLQNQSLWYDESDRLFIASLPLPQLFRTLAEETIAYLPLYFLVVKPFTDPFQETAVRYPSVFFGVLAVAFMAQVGRRLFGPNGGLMAALLLTLNPFHLWFSRDANFYAVVVLSATGALYFFLCLLRRPTLHGWIGSSLLTGLGLWTHYFAYAIPLVEFVYLVINLRRYHRLLRPWIVSRLVAFLPLLPWYLFLIRKGEFYFGTAALGPPKLLDLFYTLWSFSIGYTAEYTPVVVASLILFGGAALLGAGQIRRRRAVASLLVLLLGLPITMTFLMSLRLPMYVDRYLIGALPAFILLVVGGIRAVPRKAQGFWFAGLVLASTIGSARLYYDEKHYTKEDWRGTAHYIQTQEHPGDVIMPLLYQSLTPLIGQYYRGDLPFEPILVQDTVRLPSTFASQYQRLWYVAPHPHDSTHLLAQCQAFDLYAGVRQEEVRQWLLEHEGDLVHRQDFACLSVLLYDQDVVRRQDLEPVP